MVSPAITTTLATEEDAQTLASIMTSAFSASDAAYPLIWAGPTAPDGIHDIVAVKGLFSPVQKEDRLTFKAVDGERVVGFATWNMPKGNAAVRRKVEKGGLPNIPGVNVSLWSEKVEGLKDVADRDVEPGKDMSLSFFFVHPDYQRQGVGTLLLQWGLKKADELNAKIWLTSTPQAATAYEKNGWKIVQRYDIDLGQHGGSGIYSRAWMVRLPTGAL